MHAALDNQTLKRFDFLCLSDLMGQQPTQSNRHMRKTAHTVVWEG